MKHEDSVLLHTQGRIRHITLNRPRALNALNHAMVLHMAEALDAAEQDGAVVAVLLTGAGGGGSARAGISAPSGMTPSPAAGPHWTSGVTSTG